MVETTSAADFLPPEDGKLTLERLRQAATRCQGCDLYRHATQTVFGEGPRAARVMLVGEGPGASEDRQGRPFVGRAGALLDEALAEAGLERDQVYITNVVKHFPSTGGKRPRPRKPRVGEMRACLPWLEKEAELVQPAALVCLGATAAQAIIDRKFRITQQRGEVFETPWSPCTLATLHPAAVLRMPDERRRTEARENLVADLATAAKRAGTG